MSVSAVVITFNEEERLRACLESVAWADELVVVDAESSDKTVQIAREFTDRVWVRPWPGFPDQKNFALEQATGDWVLSVDADEEVSSELREQIEAVLGSGSASADGYLVPRQNIFWGRWVRHGGLYPDWQLRLFRRGRGRFVDHAVHESVAVTGTVGRLGTPLVHRSYRGVADFLARADRYSTLAAEAWIRSGRPARLSDLVWRPAGRFLGMYVVRAGFLDGWRGFLLASLYAYYVFIRSAKAWERARG
ncbi:MAG: glycosyltransferase family 2 protein [Candidatus Rokuibacteriota bacterium]|nr:MAG: glycosyltransferase family 2 protein [Candidatus Rokubacteria bacterium]PYN67447.1 MAG: glycosyltransferase family 2 protein [Candidatus Rokubacteria bacterium]